MGSKFLLMLVRQDEDGAERIERASSVSSYCSCMTYCSSTVLAPRGLVQDALFAGEHKDDDIARFLKIVHL